MMIEYLLYLVCGMFAGILAGLLGIGGGLIVVPILIIIFEHQHLFPNELITHAAIGTSLTVMIFTSLSSSVAYGRRKLIVWPLFVKFTPGMLGGVVLGTCIARHLSSDLLRLAFAVFMILIAAQLFFAKNAKVGRKLPHLLIITVSALLVGILSGFFGVGGGSMMVPFFAYCGVEMHKATGTSAICGFAIAIVGTICFMLSGIPIPTSVGIPAGAVGYVYWPAALIIASTSLLCAPLGTRLAVDLPSQVLKRIFSILLVATAISLLVN